MQSVQTLPATYQEVGTIDITKDQRLMVALNVLAILGLVAAGWVFVQAMFWLRPLDSVRTIDIRIGNLSEMVTLLGAAIALLAFHIVLHEAFHGVFFWLFTRSRPLFAFRWTHAYAAAPDWYIPRNAYLVTALAPLVLMTLGGLVLMRFVPTAWVLPVWFVITMNAAGSVGDLLVVVWLLRQPSTCLAQDKGDAVTLYKPALGMERTGAE
jgi:hypothetical protein